MRWLALLSVTVCVALPAAQTAAPAAQPDGATLLKPGEALFKQRCAACHSGIENARAPAPDVLRQRTPEAILTALVSGSMRVQGSRLSGPERRAIAEFVTGHAMGGDVTGASSGKCRGAAPPFPGPASLPVWSGWGVGFENTRFQPAKQAGLAAEDVPNLKLKWAFGFPDATVAWAQPAVAGGRVFVGSQNGTVYSLDAKSGCIYWTFSAQGGVRTAISVGPRAIYFGDTSANAYALDAVTGAKIWSTRVDDHALARVTGAPALYQGRLYVPMSSYEEAQGADPDYECCTFRGSISALDAKTGTVVWKSYTIPTKAVPRGKSSNGVTLYGPSGVAIWSAPTIDAKRGLIYAGTGNTYSDPDQPTDDSIIAFDLKTGAIKWTRQITPKDTFISGCRTGSTNPNCPATNGPDFDFGNSPILTSAGGRDLIVVGQKSGVGFALDPDKQGEIVWQYRAGQGGALGGLEWGSAVDGERAYFPVSDITRPQPGGLHAVNLATGERVWMTPAPAPKCGAAGRGCNAAQSAAVTAIPGVVFSGSNDGALRAYSAKDGAIIWEFDTNRDFETVNAVPAKGASMQGPGPVVAGGMVFANAGYGAFGGRPGNVLLAFDAPHAAQAHINTEIIEKLRADVQKQAADPAMKREGGTQPQDWPYTLPAGVTTRQMTFYSDGAALYAKLFFPRGFSTAGKWPAVVLGHGFNGISIGIEKFGARFAERGLVAMVIDYRTYGPSEGQAMLMEPDSSNDTKTVWEKTARVRLKRTRLNAFLQGEDYRAAISYIQGEPGVDPNRIGLWGSSYSGGVVVNTAGLDARVKAVVSQVIGVAGRGSNGPIAHSAAIRADEIKRARTGQGAEIDGGFSFRTKIDMETNQTGREHRPWQMLTRIPETTAILWVPAEKDELGNPHAPSGPFEATKVFSGVSQVAEVPYITHFQAYSGAAFEVTSTLAADWFTKFLAADRPNAPVAATEKLPAPALAASHTPVSGPADRVRDIHFFSDGVQCYGQLFLPAGFTESGKTPAVVLAPDWGQTHESVAAYADKLADAGVAAMAIDYRGWGKSGGFLYTAEHVYQDDRFRFLEATAKMRIVRKRLVPQRQIEDIRNALSYLAGEPGIDADHLGLLGEGVAAAHVASIAAVDARVKGGVLLKAVIKARDPQARQERPPADVLADAIRVARTGAAPNVQFALWDYRPPEIPATVATLSTTDAGEAVAWLSKHLQ
jgi:polyvinyl alcohol dehydrogenase (cytochrome)